MIDTKKKRKTQSVEWNENKREEEDNNVAGGNLLSICQQTMKSKKIYWFGSITVKMNNASLFAKCSTDERLENLLGYQILDIACVSNLY